MGGLLVYLQKDGPVPADRVISAMRGGGVGRGALSVRFDGPLAAGACRLEHEAEPMASDSFAIAAVHGYFFGPGRGSAAAVLLEGYREEGVSFLRRVDGEFAFALWDRRTRMLYLCRDSFGTKPLFFAADGHRLAAATEIRQVLKSGVVALSANRSKLAADFGLKRSNPEETIFSGVRRVLPSQILRFSPQLAREDIVTWAPPTTVDRSRTEEEVIDEFPRLLTRAVARRRWRRPAVSLSSGLDSASVAAVVSSDDGLREVFSAAGGPRAITLSYPGWELDETEEAGKLARLFSMSPVAVDATRTGPFETAGELGEICDQPYTATAYAVHLLLREVRRLGCDSVATGIGAECAWETAPGLAADLLRHGRWLRLFREAKGSAGLGARAIAGCLWRDAVRPWVAEGARRMGRGKRLTEPWDPGDGRWESMMWRSKAYELAGLTRASYLEVFEQLGVHEGVEMIHPFFDREVVEYAFRTPSHLMGTLASGKRLLSRAMSRRFPAAFGERPKAPGPDDFLGLTLRRTAGVLGPVRDWQLPSIVPFDAEDGELLRRIGAGEPLGYLIRPWTMIGTELWLRRHFPAAGPRAALPVEMALA